MGSKEPLVLGLIGLATLAAVGYLAFWAWFLNPRIGRVVGFLLPFVSVALCFKVARSVSDADWKLLRRTLSPLVLTLSVTLLVVFTCFSYGETANANAAARDRFAKRMPSDNELPFIFANGLIDGWVRSPMAGDWLSSDRPPLQTGMFLAHMPYIMQPRALDYTIVGIGLQSLWVFALWMLLSGYGVDRRLIALIIAVCLFSGFTFLNSVYIWPKLLAATYAIAGASVLLANKLEPIRSRPLGLALAAALITFGLLAHGGTMFAILGLVPMMLVLRRIPNVRSCWAALAAVAILYLPWFLYQKLVDPPGDRLLKWHIAGAIDVTPQPFGKLLIQNYRSRTLSQVIDNKIDNMKTVFGGDSALAKSFIDTFRGFFIGGDAGTNMIDTSSLDVRVIKGFRFFPELDILIVGFLAITVGGVRQLRTPTWRFSLTLTGWVAATILIWCALMFIPGSTVLHQGTYAIVILSYAACLSATWVVSTRLAVALGLLHIFINIVYYVLLLHINQPDEIMAEASWYGVLVFALLSACAVVYQLFRIAKTENPISSYTTKNSHTAAFHGLIV